MKSIIPFGIFLILLILLIPSFLLSQTVWTKYSENPVIEPGPAGSWDGSSVYAGPVIVINDTLHMWYTGTNGSQNLIGYATSPDGTNWTKYNDSTTTALPFAESDPVLFPGPPGSWDQYDVDTPEILLIDTIFHMWYTGDSTTANNNGFRIGHATSTDGINWSKDTLNPVLREGPPGSWDYRWIYSDGSVILVENIYHIWYSAWDGLAGLERVRIGHATSPDGRVWTKDSLNPVLSAGTAGSWDYRRVGGPFTVYTGTKYHMFYTGGESGNFQIGHATADTPYGPSWTKDTLNPVLPKGSPGSWDDAAVAYCTVVIDSMNSLFRMWYSALGSVGGVKIGYATAPFDPPTGVFDKISSNFCEYFELYKNYPNPFNPNTTISFDLHKACKVNLKIYNMLGEEVTTLLSASMYSGSYTFEWDASGLASGVYLYRLQAGEYVETRKMILMR